MSSASFSSAITILLASLFLPAHTFAEAPAPTAQESALNAAYEAAGNALQKGDILLRDQATLSLPEGFGFVPEKEARLLMTTMGNTVGTELVGMIFPLDGGNWFIVTSYEKSGFIKDDDARDWDAAELLKSLRAGTDESNKERQKRGIPEMEIIGWVEKPSYDATQNRLVWSLESRDKGEPDSPHNGINYNTYALGREGYISMNLVTAKEFIEEEKPLARDLLARLHFHEGKRYADFNPATDHVAEYGLAALVGGVAAKKLGVLAVVAAFFAKFAKLFVVGGIAVLAGARKLLSRNKAD